MSVIEKIYAGSASIGVIGLGYVGLAEAIEFTKARFNVTGFEIDPSRVTAITEGRSYIIDVSNEDLQHAVRTGLLTATSDMTRLGEMDAILICVPTPLGKTKAPDLSYIMGALESIRANLRAGQLVVLESTTYPGTTTEVVRPALESGGLTAGYDFHLCFAPERINPGDRDHPASKIPRIVGGLTAQCAEAAKLLYSRIAPEVVVVSSPEAAEMVKLLENTFRAVNIGLVNELALMCRSLGIDVWEIISAAATKPFGFMPFYPGPGLGGHCIPIDPLYLSWKARVNGFDPRFIELAHQVNSAMPRFVVTLVTDTLNQAAMSVKGSTILVLGVSYKPDVNDARESPATSVIAELWQRGATVFYHDPHVPVLEVHGQWIRSVPLDDYFLTNADCVVILTHHSAVDWARVVERAPRIVDTRNVTRRYPEHRPKVVHL